ncbi:hypothetical protein ACWOFR_06355 [Carnobacterium gallinarum]|uniref:hypothetical protein n=1 Tax=Carnobacterium gallinarum TaxID=2749 RepID=UPI000A3DD045|nr:hypothetical protein [Carnobacterium gallinarum]
MQLFGDETNLSAKEIACLYSLSNHVEEQYESIIIAKRDGSPRQLLAPSPLLKKIQKNILLHILEGMPCSIYATAYQKGTTTPSYCSKTNS